MHLHFVSHITTETSQVFQIHLQKHDLTDN